VDQQDQLVNKVLLDQQDPLDLLVQLVNLDSKVQVGSLVTKACKVLKDNKDPLDRLVKGARMVCVVRLEQLD
jgi:hypothetical protein